MKIFRGEKGVFAITELMMVVAIIGILLVVFYSSYTRFVHRNRVRAGIHAVFAIKKAMEGYSMSCRGYPVTSAPPSEVELRNIIDPETDANKNICDMAATAAPTIYPDPPRGSCDAVGLKDFISGNICSDACDYDDTECWQGRISTGFTDNFVSGAGSPYHSPYGWGYALPTVGDFAYSCGGGGAPALQDDATQMQEPCAVYYGNVRYYDKYITIVVNSDGMGRIDPAGAVIATGCPCGPWCSDDAKLSGTGGCCSTCSDPAGGGSVSGVGFRF
ncbi:MAG: hypothetical protein AB1546_05825 [bacterium]